MNTNKLNLKQKKVWSNPNEALFWHLSQDIRFAEETQSYNFKTRYVFDNGMAIAVARKTKTGKKPKTERGEFTSLGASKGLYEVALFIKGNDEMFDGLDAADDIEWPEETLEGLTPKQKDFLKYCIMGYITPEEAVELAKFIAGLDPQD